MGLLKSAGIHEEEQIVGELSDGEGSSPPRCLPVPSGVQGIDVIGQRERIDLPCEIVTVLSVSVQEDQRLSPALFYEMVYDIHATFLF